MNKQGPFFIVSLFLISLCLSGPGCSQKGAPGKAAGPGAAGPGGMRGDRTPRVEIAKVQIKPLVLEKQYVGEIKPNVSVDVRSTTSGWLTSINVDVGDRVPRNGKICEINHEDMQTQLEQAQAGVSVAEAAVSRSEAEFERAALESTRTKLLFDKGYVSRRDLEQAVAVEKQAAAAVDAAKGQLEQARAQVKGSKIRLGDTTLRAPFSGIVAERYVDTGAYVSPANPIIKIVDDARVKAVVNVVQEDEPRFSQGNTAILVLDAFPGEEFHGTILRVSPSIDAVSKTAVVEILVPNEDRRLKSGMTVRARMVAEENLNAMVIPETALRQDIETGLSYVFTVKDSKALRHDVKVGMQVSGEVEILNGLRAGDMVVTGDMRLKDGMKVELMQQKRKGFRK